MFRMEVLLHEGYVNRVVGAGGYLEYLYIYHDDSGAVEAFVPCSAAANFMTPCTKVFDMPEDMKSEMSVQFRVGLLGKWKEIKKPVSDVVMGFVQ